MWKPLCVSNNASFLLGTAYSEIATDIRGIGGAGNGDGATEIACHKLAYRSIFRNVYINGRRNNVLSACAARN